MYNPSTTSMMQVTQIDNMAISIEYRFQELQGATLVFPPKRNEDGSMPEFDIPEGALVFPEMATVVLILSRLQKLLQNAKASIH